jgi:hypothetical protein
MQKTVLSSGNPFSGLLHEIGWKFQRSRHEPFDFPDRKA